MVPSEIQKKRFVELTVQLSPENLTYDGEATPADTKQRLKSIMSKWHALERECGMKVTQSMAYQWSCEGI